MSDNAKATAAAAKSFWQSMKSQPRSPKHGNRKPAAQTHGDPPDGAGTLQPIRTGLPPATWRTLHHGVPITRIATVPTVSFDLTVNSIDPGVGADNLKQMQEMMAKAMRNMMLSIPDYADMLLPNPKPPEIPFAGISVGEIIGWRVWWVNHDGRLRSFIRDEIVWEPGEAMTGNINERVHVSLRGPDRFGGVYCFNNYQAAMNEFTRVLFDLKTGRPGVNKAVGLILGTVKLWGEVVEHQGGYRASFAKPNEFLKTYYWDKGSSRDPYELYFEPRPAIDSSGWTG